jgi:fibro-slime domain-containing protein
MYSVAGVATALVCINGLTLADSEPQTMTLTGVIRDFPSGSSHPDFQDHPPATPGVKSGKNVALELDENKKPVYVGDGQKVQAEWKDADDHVIGWCQPAAAGDVSGEFNSHDDGGVTNSITFAQWFRDVPSVNMSCQWSITLTKEDDDDSDDDEECWVYQTDEFHPIDEQLFGNGPDEHNFYFTYEVVAQFTYTAADDQYFWYKGSDDAWVFINDKLVIDHGGLAVNRDQRIDFNRLGLTEGAAYELRFFMAERVQPEAHFHIRTNVELTSSASASVFALFD